MKTIYVNVWGLEEAARRAERLCYLLRDFSEVTPYLNYGNTTVRTKKVYVRYIPRSVKIDGMRCDIPCGFGTLGKIMTNGKPYKRLSTESEIAEFIIDEEANSDGN